MKEHFDICIVDEAPTIHIIGNISAFRGGRWCVLGETKEHYGSNNDVL